MRTDRIGRPAVKISRILTLLVAIHSTSIACVANSISFTRPVSEDADALDVEQSHVPLSWLHGKKRPAIYRLGSGDVMGVFIEGILPENGQILPNQPKGEQPRLRVPIAIDENGKISLPFVDDVDVNGLTLAEAEEAIREALGKRILKDANKHRILIELVRERRVSVTVVRMDMPPKGTASRELKFEVPEVRADLLSALARSGGLSQNSKEAVILRQLDHGKSSSKRIKIRIPLMRSADSKRPEAKHVILQTGDIVIVKP